MRIYVHSKGRAGLRKGTLEALEPLKDMTTIVCPIDQFNSYQEAHPGFNFAPVPIHWNLPEVQQGIVEFAHKQTHKKIIMMDDDLRFAHRIAWDPIKLATQDTNTLINMISGLDRVLNNVAHATISPRQGNNRADHIISNVGSARSVLAFRTDILKKHNIRFDRVPSKSDYDATLQLLRLGYHNTILWNYTHDQTGGPTLPGGCTESRTADVHQRASEALAALHPGFIKVVVKEKAAWTNTGGKRHDVVVYWKKAYQSSTPQSVPPLIRSKL